MALTYGAIARGAVIVCDYGTAALSVSQVAQKILQKIPDEPTMGQAVWRKSYRFNGNVYHYETDQTDSDAVLTVMVVTPESSQEHTSSALSRTAFRCLAELKNQFLGDPAVEQKWPTASANSLTPLFARAIADALHQHSKSLSLPSGAGGDSLATARAKIDDVKEIMISNLDKTIQRGDKLDSLLERTDILADSATEFHQRSRSLQRNIWWQNWKLCLIGWSILVVLILVMVLVILSTTGVI